MFRAVISRDNGEPWGNTGMTTAKWLHIPAETATIADLIATQPGILLAPLIEQTPPVGGDPTPHIIRWNNTMYLEDGHHRVIRALLNGATTIQARILDVP